MGSIMVILVYYLKLYTVFLIQALLLVGARCDFLLFLVLFLLLRDCCLVRKELFEGNGKNNLLKSRNDEPTPGSF